MRIDHIDFVLLVDLPGEGNCAFGNRLRIAACAYLGNQRKARAVHRQPAFNADRGQIGQRLVAAKGNWRDANRIDHGDLPVAAFGERFQ